jgi:transcriptional regulator with XRE-family HTH domain
VNVKFFREKAGLSQIELAHKLKVGQALISQWETNRSLPRANKLLNISKTLNCTVDELLQPKDLNKDQKNDVEKTG